MVVQDESAKEDMMTLLPNIFPVGTSRSVGEVPVASRRWFSFIH
jgi:hypothetical protein